MGPVLTMGAHGKNLTAAAISDFAISVAAADRPVRVANPPIGGGRERTGHPLDCGGGCWRSDGI
jgi:hypothetical protein